MGQSTGHEVLGDCSWGALAGPAELGLVTLPEVGLGIPPAMLPA
jgi:hypothetical protein